MTAETSPRPWSLFIHDEQEGGGGEVAICAEGEWIATMNLGRSTAKADAALIVNAVNIYDHQFDRYMQALRAERDRLRDALDEVCSRVSVALNCPRHETEQIDLLVHGLLGIKECARAALGEKKK